MISIGDYAFSGCFRLTTVIIPTSVTSIGNEIFTACSNLTTISLTTPVMDVGKNVFKDCPKLTFISISIPNMSDAEMQNLLEKILNGETVQWRSDGPIE